MVNKKLNNFLRSENKLRRYILEMLKKSKGKPVSGAEISKKIEISRTAVWKHMNVLKNEGYDIESVPKKGYILHSVPNRLLPEEVVSFLETKWLGHDISYSESVASTNSVAKDLGNQNCSNGQICICEEQLNGRGRLRRGWFSPYAKGVWFSIVLKPSCMPNEASKFTLFAAVAVVKAINTYKGVEAKIKWPNDILIDNKKLVGILTEMNAEFGHINYIVIGTGINVNVTKDILPEDIKNTSISLMDVSKEPISRAELLAKILKNMEELYETIEKDGFSEILKQWRELSCTLGQEVKVIAPDETYFGIAEDIDEEGLLLVKRKDGKGLSRVIAGDVSIRSVDGEKY
jgi:BirA family biotin operon repressor/biotin-[acetyl-CoA-carboxylase] ligase